MNYAYIGGMTMDPWGGVHIQNPVVRGSDAGVSAGMDGATGSAGISVRGNRPVSIHGGDLSDNQVGVEAREGSNMLIRNSSVRGNHVADFAYHQNAHVQLAHVYAEKMFELTNGRFSTVDNDVNFIANQILSCEDPEKMKNLADRLRSKINSVPDWAVDGAKYDVATELIKLILYSQI